MKTLLLFAIVMLALSVRASAKELLQTIRSGDVAAVRQLISFRKGRIDARLGAQALREAVASDSTHMLEMLLNSGIPPDLIHPKFASTVTEFLEHPGHRGDPEAKLQMLDLIRQARAQTNGEPVRVQVRAVTQEAILREIDRMQAEINGVRRATSKAVISLEWPDRHGRTWLMRAASIGQAETVRFLLRNGAKSDAIDRAGRTASDYACSEAKDQPDKEKQCEEIRRLLTEAMSGTHPSVK